MSIRLVSFSVRACLVISCIALGACPSTPEQVRPESKTLVTEVIFQPNEPGKTIKLRMHPGYVVDLVGWWEPLMPRGQSRRPNPGEPDSHVWLWMLWPSLDFKTKDNAPRFMDPKGPGLTMLVSGLAGVRVRSGRPTAESHLRTSLGIALESALHPPGHLDLPMVEFPTRHGLRVFGAARDKANPSSLWPTMAQIHIPKDSDIAGERRRFISCMFEDIPEPEESPASFYVPHCRHYFVSHSLGALVNVRYRRKYLSEWREIEAQVEAKLKSFVVEQR